jgi:hypothetical protein
VEIIRVPVFMNSEQPVPHTRAGKDKGLGVRRTSEEVSCHLNCEHAQSTTFILMKPERCEQTHTTNDSVLRNLKKRDIMFTIRPLPCLMFCFTTFSVYQTMIGAGNGHGLIKVITRYLFD